MRREAGTVKGGTTGTTVTPTVPESLAFDAVLVDRS